MASTKERIFVIANNLDANGQNPTMSIVRKHLGGGSFITIIEAMTEWMTNKSIKKSQLIYGSQRQSVTKLIGELGDLLLLTFNQTEGRLVADRELSVATRNGLEALRGRVAAMEIVEQTARDETDIQLKKTFVTLNERVVTTETALVEIANRVEKLYTELTRLNKNNSGLNRTQQDSVKGRKKTKALESSYKQMSFEFLANG